MSVADSNDFAPLTDDKRASDTSGTPRPDSPMLVPRYDFSYYEFERKEKAPSFKPHAFWTTLSSAAGLPLAKLSVVCRNPKHEIDDKTADNIVNQALPSFRLAASTLSAKGRVPPDITITLAGIQYLIVDNPAVSSEWEFFPFPPSEIIPAYPIGKSPPRAATTADAPTKDQINNAPHLSKIAHPAKPSLDVAVSPPPANTSVPKPARVTGRYGQFLKVVRVPVDVVGALEVRVGLELGEGLVLLVLLHKLEAELGLELGPGGEWEQDSH
ncbi:hypothetical protein B0H14DRAFT_3449878 [Mycena olivaceomarginata]|nr:hypothetical protein B0H14DRAFT_3449878 [Mycena olivaceomarginata]